MAVTAVIPARSGSKGVPGKNTMLLGGKPLVTHAIEVALRSQHVKDIIVTSDSEEVRSICDGIPQVVFCQRPSALSGDEVAIGSVIQDLFNSGFIKSDLILLLQPTSPLRTAGQVDEAIDLICDRKEVNSVASIIQMNDVHPARMYEKEGGLLRSLNPKWESNRRQELPNVFCRNGAIYISKTAEIMRSATFMNAPTMGYEMSPLHWLNIDDMRDAVVAEAMFVAWSKGVL